jgi:purine-binding chemotaxis protein CheW
MNEDQKKLGGRYICFSLGQETFAIPLLEVKEVIGNIDITPIPQSPIYYKGIMNLRGQVIPVIDLRIKLKSKKCEKINETTIIILDFNPYSVGIMVDSIECVSTFEAGDISSTFEIESIVQSRLIIGVAKKEKSMTLILDLRAVLEISKYHELATAA